MLVSCRATVGPDFKKLAPLPNEDICRIAILPLVNNTEYLQGDIIFTRIFMSDLIGEGNYLVPHEGDIHNAYRLLKIYPRQALDSEQIRLLAERLDVQLVIRGEIFEMEDKSSGRNRKLSIGVLVKVYDGVTGAAIWSIYNRREGDDYRKVMHFGVINNITELCKVVSREIIEAWFEQGLRRCIDY